MSLDLRPNEYVKIEVHFSYKVFVLPMFLMCIGFFVFLAVWAGIDNNAYITWLGHVIKVSALMIALGIALFLPYVYKRIDNRLKIYAVTNQRVYIRRGIINIHEKDIPLAKINDVQIMQTLIQRMFKAGNVVIQVGNDESRICIEDVNFPREFRDTVISAIYDLQQEDIMRQREFQKQQEQERLYNNRSANNYNPNYDNYGSGYNQSGYNQSGGYQSGGGYSNQGSYDQGGYTPDPDEYNPDGYQNNGGYRPRRF